MTFSIASTLPDLLDVLSVAEAPRTFTRKQPIYTRGSQGLYLVQEGAVRVFRTSEDGSREHVDFYGPGHFFGLSVFESKPRHETAVAHSDCAILAWPEMAVAASMEARPDAARALLRASVEQSARLYERTLRAERLKIELNLRATVIDLARRIGVDVGGGSWQIRPSVTHEALSECVGTSREIVTFYLNRFRDQGSIDFSRQAMIVRPELLSSKRRSAAA